MELFTYLMAKNDHNTSVKKDLFSYLLGKNQSGTYTEFTGTSISANNTKKGKMKVNLLGNISQTGTPTPSTPIPVNVVSGDNTITTSNGDNTQSTSYPIHLGEIELCKIGDYKDRFFKNIPNTTDYKSDLEDNEWYLEKKIGKVVLDGSENWNNDGGTQGTNYRHNIYYLSRMTIPPATGTSGTYLSNYFGAVNIASDSGVLGSFYISEGWIVFTDKDKTYDLAGWKNWLSTHNTVIYYALATPTYTPITGTLKDELEALQKAQSYKGTTNINQINNDLPFNLDVEIKVGN